MHFAAYYFKSLTQTTRGGQWYPSTIRCASHDHALCFLKSNRWISLLSAIASLPFFHKQPSPNGSFMFFTSCGHLHHTTGRLSLSLPTTTTTTFFFPRARFDSSCAVLDIVKILDSRESSSRANCLPPCGNELNSGRHQQTTLRKGQSHEQRLPRGLGQRWSGSHIVQPHRQPAGRQLQAAEVRAQPSASWKAAADRSSKGRCGRRSCHHHFVNLRVGLLNSGQEAFQRPWVFGH